MAYLLHDILMIALFIPVVCIQKQGRDHIQDNEGRVMFSGTI